MQWLVKYSTPAISLKTNPAHCGVPKWSMGYQKGQSLPPSILFLKMQDLVKQLDVAADTAESRTTEASNGPGLHPPHTAS
eukprot:1144043-Pelagomonas_calceolata.AAC.2